MMVNPHLLLGFLCLWPLAAAAADVTPGIPVRDVGVDLHVARDEIELTGGGSDHRTRLSRIGMTWRESIDRYLSMQLSGGYASAGEFDQALTAGMDFSGGYAGVTLHGRIPLTRRLHFGLAGGVLYHWMRDRIGEQKVELDWAQADASLTLQSELAGIGRLYAGPVWSGIEVDQRAAGPVNSTTGFDNRETTGAVIGLLLEVESQGWIGMELRRGPLDGAALSFQRGF